jgi:hypothetical protein
MQERLENLEAEVRLIQERNLRVSADKAWETSLFRVLAVSVMIYLVACFVLFMLGVESFLSSALIPAVGYFLSTQSLPPIKRWWMQKYIDKATGK